MDNVSTIHTNCIQLYTSLHTVYVCTHRCSVSLLMIKPVVILCPITQVTLETPCLVTVRRSIREDVLKMESTLLTLTVQTRNHSMFIATTNTPSSREEWMDPRISIEVGQTMFWALVQSGVSSGWVWRRSTVSLQELPELK